jgi:hypothetical protein
MLETGERTLYASAGHVVVSALDTMLERKKKKKKKMQEKCTETRSLRRQEKYAV